MFLPKDYKDLLSSFRSDKNSMSIVFKKTDGLKAVTFLTLDGEPDHAVAETFIMGGKKEDATLEDLVSLYVIAEEADPHNKLTRVLKGVVLERVRQVRIELSRQLESVEFLIKHIITTDGRVDVSSGHP